MQVHGVRIGDEAVTVLRGLDRFPAQRAPEAAHECLQGARGVGRRVAVPHLVDEHPGRDRTSGAQREHGEQGAQPRPAEGDGRAVGTEGAGGTEDAVVHGPIVRDGTLLRGTTTRG